MNFGNLKDDLRFFLPQASVRRVSNARLERALNEAALHVAADTEALKVSEKFDVTKDISEYSLSSKLKRYIKILEPGLWWNDGSLWQELYPKTIHYMDEKHPTWRSDGSGSPQRYALWGDNFMPHPKPGTTLAEGFWAYFSQRPLTMSASTHFPFHEEGKQTTERSDLSILSDIVVIRAEWKILKALNKKQEAFEKWNEYQAEKDIKIHILNDRQDLSGDPRAKFQGPRMAILGGRWGRSSTAY